MHYSVFKQPPKDFRPTVEVAGCFCQWQDKILYLKRHPGKPQGETWGLPAGKLEKGEDARRAAAREVDEEVGIKIKAAELVEVGSLYIRFEQIDYVFHIFRKRFQTQPSVDLDLRAHTEAKWVTVEEALRLPLIVGGKEILEFISSS